MFLISSLYIILNAVFYGEKLRINVVSLEGLRRASRPHLIVY